MEDVSRKDAETQRKSKKAGTKLPLRRDHYVRSFRVQVGELAACSSSVHYFDEVHQGPLGIGEGRWDARGVVAGLGVERHFGGLVIVVLGGVAIPQADPLHTVGGGHLCRNFQAGSDRQKVSGGRGAAGRAQREMRGSGLRRCFLALGLQLFEVAGEELIFLFPVAAEADGGGAEGEGLAVDVTPAPHALPPATERAVLSPDRSIDTVS